MTGAANSTPRGRDIFATTRWTVVLAAGQGASPLSDRALEELCSAYWFPLYAYIRRRGHSREDAEDLTQAFFARFLEKKFLDGLSPERGKFRAYLLAALKHFLANAWDKSQTLKRGGQAVHLSLDWETADLQYAASSLQNPDRAFDREWAVSLLERVIGQLQASFAADGRSRDFEILKVFLTAGRGEYPHSAAAHALGMDEGALRVAIHRLRKKYRQLLRQEITHTLVDPSQADEEMRVLFGAFGDS